MWYPLKAKGSPYEGLEHNRARLGRVSRDLVALYEGDQLGYVIFWLAAHLKDARIRQKYLELAVTHNIIRLVIDRVSTVGQVRVVWMNRTTRQPDRVAQDIWEALTAEWMSSGWDNFVPILQRRTELVKTLLAGVEWDPWAQKIALTHYTPAEVDVEYDDDNPNPAEPDRYVFKQVPSEQALETWDFSSREPGPSGFRKLPESSERTPLEVLDPRTGRSAVPFVPFRTAEGKQFFIWDGQEQLVQAQEFVNRLYTRISVLTEMGTNKVMVLGGSGWADAEGNLTPIPLDIGMAIKKPETGSLDHEATLTWDGPNVVAEIDSAIRIASHFVQATAATLRISGRVIYGSNEPASGYSLQIEDAALRVKHEESKRLMRAPLQRLVKLICLYWQHYGPADMQFPDDAYPTVIIPDLAQATVSTNEAQADIALCAAGLKRRLPVIYRYEPEIPPEAAADLAALPTSQPIRLTEASPTAPGPTPEAFTGPGENPALQEAEIS